MPSFEIKIDSFVLDLSPGAIEIDDINAIMNQKCRFCFLTQNRGAHNINEVSCTNLKTIRLNSVLNKLLGFTYKMHPERNHRSEKPVMISSVDKDHLKCDFVHGSIVNRARE